MMAAMSQKQLREKYQQLKNKGQDEIIREANALVQAAEPADSETEIGALVAAGEASANQAKAEKVSQLYFRVVKTKSEVYDIITRSFSRKS